eukprot:108396-Amphidinium_carterae.1
MRAKRRGGWSVLQMLFRQSVMQADAGPQAFVNTHNLSADIPGAVNCTPLSLLDIPTSPV